MQCGPVRLVEDYSNSVTGESYGAMCCSGKLHHTAPHRKKQRKVKSLESSDFKILFSIMSTFVTRTTLVGHYTAVERYVREFAASL